MVSVEQRRGAHGDSWGEDTDAGEWHINDQDQYCSEWFGEWAKGIRCSIVYPGTDQNEHIQAIVSGKKSEGNLDGIYSFKLTSGDTTDK